MVTGRVSAATFVAKVGFRDRPVEVDDDSPGTEGRWRLARRRTIT
jgi:hypothetical protein